MNFADNEILKYAQENGMIDLAIISEQMEQNMKSKYLSMHEGKVWKGENGSWYTYLNLSDGQRKLVRKKTKEDLEKEIISHYRHDADTFGQMFYRWIDWKLSHNEIFKQTADRYIINYKKYFEPLSKRIFCEITERELEEFIRNLIAEHQMTAKEWSGARTVILGVFSFGKYESDFSISQFMGDLRLAPKVFRKAVKRDEDDVFTKDELVRIEADLMEKPDAVGYAVLLAMRTGMRIGEVCALKWEDIQGDVIHVHRTEIRYKESYKVRNGHKERIIVEVRDFTKGAVGERKIVITQDDVEFIKKIRASNPFGEYVFMKGKKRVTSKCLTPKLSRCCDRIGIPRRSMHKLRKTYATSLLNANVPAGIIKEQMGHTDLKTTVDYYYRENHSHSEVKSTIEEARKNAI